MIYWQLILTFLKIGLFAFGGGYAVLPLIQRELVVNHRWLTDGEFSRLVSVAEMTPGPIGINSSTFAGYVAGGFWGSLLATLAVCLPSLVILFFLHRMLKRFARREEEISNGVFQGLRPVVIALVAYAVFTLARGAFTGPATWLMALAAFGLFLMDETAIVPIILVFGLVGILIF
ncbi:MAG TPA: chromate transporter [bacterium]|uniref:Putative chromate transport protein n=1 Tax=candidate division TA06 bacterium ADurb.Bin417 TaxID=1852828 RepID=A0A1V5MJS1_UNCT6|nr:MAG: putative chromate transport protein [candidate division TA06 bacterium ADurb.Bin417]HNS48055.1 chromate transporter [bacterium]